MKTPKLIAGGLIAAGLVIGGSTVAHATTASPYVTVAWSYAGYPDLTQPQPYVASTPGADLHAFDALAGSSAWCGQPLQVDVYKLTDEHGRSWETLKETGALLYAHDGGFLAYDAGVGTPYRVIYPEEIQCTTATPEPTPTETSTPTPTSTPSTTPQPEPSETPSSGPTSTPTLQPTIKPTPTPSPTTPPVTPQPTDQPTAPTPTAGTTPPIGPTVKPSVVPSTPTSKQTRGNMPASTSSAAPVAGDTSRAELAYTGANPWPGIAAAALLIAAGAALLFARARKAAKR